MNHKAQRVKKNWSKGGGGYKLVGRCIQRITKKVLFTLSIGGKTYSEDHRHCFYLTPSKVSKVFVQLGSWLFASQ